MGELNLEELSQTLCKGVRMIVAVRRLAKDVNLDNLELATLEREVRESAGEVNKAIVATRDEGVPAFLGY